MQTDRTIVSSRNSLSAVAVAPDVAYLTTVFVNVYLVGAPGGPWVLVDTGLPYAASFIRRAAERRYGPAARPAAVILTHGHFDHAGSALDLAVGWDVPVYAHPLELPYLTGRSDYPPQDPTMGGAIAQMSRLFPHAGYNLGSRVRPLPEDGSIPELPGWRWIHTPGHTPGHISLFRAGDRLLLAGDAVTTMDLDSWVVQATEAQEIDRPPAPFTTDWEAARHSVERLAELRPAIVAAGHGIPLAGPDVPAALQRFAARFPPPPTGRYVAQSARADDRGVVALPPPVPDPFPRWAVRALVLSAAIAAIARGKRLIDHDDHNR